METLTECEKTRQKSATLRGTLDAILINAARDLRTQADNVEKALNSRIACMDEVRVKLENDLNDVGVLFLNYFSFFFFCCNNIKIFAFSVFEIWPTPNG